MVALVRRACAYLSWTLALLFAMGGARSLCLAQSAPPATSQLPVPVLDVTRLQQPRLLDTTWFVYAGDDPAYSRPDFDDSKWARFVVSRKSASSMLYER